MILRQNDVGTVLQFRVRKGSGNVNLTGATITLEGKRADGTTFGGACSISDAAAGRFTYSVTAPDTSIAGVHKFSVRIQFGADTVARLPRYGDERLEVLVLKLGFFQVPDCFKQNISTVSRLLRHPY